METVKSLNDLKPELDRLVDAYNKAADLYDVYVDYMKEMPCRDHQQNGTPKEIRQPTPRSRNRHGCYAPHTPNPSEDVYGCRAEAPVDWAATRCRTLAGTLSDGAGGGGSTTASSLSSSDVGGDGDTVLPKLAIGGYGSH